MGEVGMVMIVVSTLVVVVVSIFAIERWKHWMDRAFKSEREKSVLNGDLAGLRVLHKELERERDGLEDSLGGAHAQCETLREQGTSLQEQLDFCKNQLNEANRVTKGQMDEVTEVRATLSAARAVNRELVSERDKYLQDAARLTDRVERLKVVYDATLEQVKNLQDQIAGLQELNRKQGEQLVKSKRNDSPRDPNTGQFTSKKKRTNR